LRRIAKTVSRARDRAKPFISKMPFLGRIFIELYPAAHEPLPVQQIRQ
jgi:hypothetical protein